MPKVSPQQLNQTDCQNLLRTVNKQAKYYCDLTGAQLASSTIQPFLFFQAKQQCEKQKQAEFKLAEQCLRSIKL